MAEPVTQINTASDTWQTVIDRLNLLANLASNVIVTANADANGALTTGNAHINGVMSATRLAALELSGGNVQATALLTISTNVSVGNSTANIVITPGVLDIGNSTVNAHINSSALWLSANLKIDSTSFLVGNSSVNTTANSSEITTGSAALRTNVSVGANVYISTDNLFIGNSTVNTTANSSAITSDEISLRSGVNVGANVQMTTGVLSIGNSTINAQLNSSTLVLGNTIINSTALTAAEQLDVVSDITVGNSTVNVYINTSSLTIVGNLFVNSSTLLVGNSTVNSTVDASLVATGNLTARDEIRISTGTSNIQMNSSVITNWGDTNNTQITQSTITLANSTTNTVITRSAVSVGSNVSLDATGLLVGNSTVNVVINSSSVNVVGSINPTVAVNVGANVRLTTGTLLIGNSTINTVANSSTVTVENLRVSTGSSNITMNSSTIANWGGVNNVQILQSSITLANSTTNTVINRDGITVGSNVSLGAASMRIGNSTVNTIVNGTTLGGVERDNWPVVPIFATLAPAVSLSDTTFTTLLSSPINLVAPDHYHITAFLSVDGPDAAGIKLRFTGTSDGNFYGFWNGYPEAGSSVNHVPSLGQSIPTTTVVFRDLVTQRWVLRFEGNFRCTTAGTFNLQAGQQVANVLSTTVQLRSFLSLQKMDGV